jgi:hypothetical protein
MEKASIPKVIVISGKDEKKRAAVVSFLANLGVEPVIPQQENGHKFNLVEKLGKNYEAPFAILLAIVLLSAITFHPIYCEWLCPFKVVSEFEAPTSLATTVALGIFPLAFLGLGAAIFNLRDV